MRTLLVGLLLIGRLIGQQPSPDTLSMSASPPTGVQNLSVTTTGIQGGNSFCYWVVAVFPGGMAGQVNRAACLNNSNGTLTSSNFNTVFWSTVTSATGYWVLRTVGTSFPGSGTNAVNATVLGPNVSSLQNQSNTLNPFTYAPMATANASFRLVNTGTFIFPNIIGDTAYNITYFANLPPAASKSGILYVVYDSPSATTCSGGGGTGTPSLCLSNGVTWIPMATSVSGGTTTVQTNGVNITSQNPINFTNSAIFNGLTFTFGNPAGGIIQSGATGTLDNSGLTGGVNYVRNNQANTYTAGSKQSFLSNGTSAMWNLGNFVGDPASLSTSDMWYDSSRFLLRYIWSGIKGSLPYVNDPLPATGLCAQWLANGQLSAASAPCGSGGGGGGVSSFAAGNLSPYFTSVVSNPTTTPVLSFNANTFAADNILGNFTGSTAIPSTQLIPTCANDGLHALVFVGHILTCSTLTTGGAGTVTNVSWTGGIVTVTNPTTTPSFSIAGTNGGIPYFTSGATWGTSPLLQTSKPVLGGGGVGPPTTGTTTGSTTLFVTSTGAQTSGNCVQIDALGNHIASGAPCGSGSGGGSVFDGSTAQINTFSATPTVSLANVSSKSPTRIEMGTLTGNVTSVTFTNVPTQGGAKFTMVWSQDGTGGRTVTYGGIVVGNCVVDPTLAVTTTQEFEVTSSGANIVGTGCTTDHTGVEGGPESAAPITPTAGNWFCWTDSTTHIRSCKQNNSATVSSMVVPNTCGGSNFVSGISSSGVVTCGTPAGSGNVSASGTPLIHQLGVWTNSTAIAGIAVGATNKPLVGVSGADPTFSNLTLTNPATTATLTLANNSTFATAGANALTFSTSGTTDIIIPPGSSAMVVNLMGGTATLGTSAIAANSCATAVAISATGVATTDVIQFTPNADISGVTGYGAGASDGLVIYPYPTANTINFKVCNLSGSSITPGAVTLNFKVLR